jgi:adenylate cyclase
MAFWNAPTDDPDHVRGGCLTALETAYATNELCDEWVDAGQAPFFTRFGLHTGECIVGNVGSADRMNYTAVGRAVNLASRLEGLNKRFGTQILVSATVRYAAREEFLFRSVGLVQPKGSHQPMEVYTLDASLPGAGLPHPATPEQLDLVRLHERGYALLLDRHFAEAARLFEELLAGHPEDGLTRFMRERAATLATNPPAPSWDGIQIFHSK